MRSRGPHLPVFQYADGKVLGGQLAEEAKAEISAAKKLNAAWKEEFPDQVSPFRIPLSYAEFDAYVISKENPDEVRICRLGTTSWAQGDTSRLDCFVGPLPPEGLSEMQYIVDFSKQLAQAVMVMHKKLNGTFSSSRGTSISLGNITLRGYVYDYETVQLPQRDRPISLEQFQLQDIYQALMVIASIAYELDHWGLISEGFRSFYLHYTQNSKQPDEYKEKVERLKSENLAELVNIIDELIYEIVNIIDRNTEWNRFQKG